MPNSERSVYVLLLAAACGLLLFLPFVTTFNDFLTTGVMNAGWTGPIQALAVPEARMVVAFLGLFGVKAGADGAHLEVFQGAHSGQVLFISWNCIGWQSLVLLLISFLPGLRGGYPLESRLQVILIGVLGTVIVNLVRMSGVALLLVWWGYEPAILFHDYGGTLMIAGWLFAFWAFIHRWILPEPVDQHALVSGS